MVLKEDWGRKFREREERNVVAKPRAQEKMNILGPFVLKYP
jgi:hypothetical protein